MAFEEDHPVYDDDLEEDHPVYNNDLDEDDDDAVAGDSESSSDTDDGDANSTAVTVAIPTSVAAPSSAVTVALPDLKRQRIDDSSAIVPVEKKPIDDSRKLFQRLWTDEDEIELLRGFLNYTTSRGSASSGHHDTAAFYDQIKSKLQLEFNKNQLVEKLRRLKKKYRNVLSKMSPGKEFAFKSPHDQATFEISKKIWSNLSGNQRGPVEFDDDDQNPNPNPNPRSMATATPPHHANSTFIISRINLNSAATSVDHKAGSSSNNALNFDLMSNLNNTASAAKLSSRKRPRVGKIDDKFVKNENFGGIGCGEGVNVNVSNHNNNDLSSSMQGLIEETLRSCLPPLFKELMNNAVTGCGSISGGGFKGIGALALNATPLNFSGLNLGNNGEGMDEKWRKQQILELEVYAKRLELVQHQIKSTLDELRSMES